MSSWEAAGQTDEWYTPRYIFDALGCKFDLDVAHPKQRTHVPAKRVITANSLDLPWDGFVWMNPPYGKRNGLVPWLRKFIEHGNGIALVPDRTSAPWFQQAAVHMDAILFVSPKIEFERPDGTTGTSPGSGSALMASGTRAATALRHGGKALGLLTIPQACVMFEKLRDVERNVA